MEGRPGGNLSQVHGSLPSFAEPIPSDWVSPRRREEQPLGLLRCQTLSLEMGGPFFDENVWDRNRTDTWRVSSVPVRRRSAERDELLLHTNDAGEKVNVTDL
jgi:hypothetical protein